MTSLFERPDDKAMAPSECRHQPSVLTYERDTKGGRMVCDQCGLNGPRVKGTNLSALYAFHERAKKINRAVHGQVSD